MKRLKKQFFIGRYSCMLEGKQKHSRSCLPPVYVDAEQKLPQRKTAQLYFVRFMTNQGNTRLVAPKLFWVTDPSDTEESCGPVL